MKFSLIVAALAFSAQAKFNPKEVPESMRGEHTDRYSGEGKQRKGTHALEYRDLADAELNTVYCLREARMFDSSCHQYRVKEGKDVRYADYTDLVDGDERSCALWEDDGDTFEDRVTIESTHCLAQDCMFDYCLWRRDVQLEKCEKFVVEWQAEVAQASVEAGEDVCLKEKGGVCLKTKVDIEFYDYTGKSIKMAQKKSDFKRPGWGNVYNYGNMHNDLLDGEFPDEDEQCDLYYQAVDVLEAELGY